MKKIFYGFGRSDFQFSGFCHWAGLQRNLNSITKITSAKVRQEKNNVIS